MALGALSLSVTQGVQGRPFQAKINGLTTGKVEVVAGGPDAGSSGFSTVNGNVMSEGLPYPTSTVVLREYEPGVGQGYRDSRIDIVAVTRRKLLQQATAALGVGRVLVRAAPAAIVSDGTLAYSLYVEDDLGATQKLAVGNSSLPAMPNFPQTVKQLRQISDVTFTNASGTATLTQIASAEAVDGRPVLQVDFGTTPCTLTFAIPPAAADLRNSTVVHWMKKLLGGTNVRCEVRLYSSGTAASPSTNYHQYGGSTILTEVMQDNIFQKFGVTASEAVVSGGTGANLQSATLMQIRLSTTTGTGRVLISDALFTPNPRTTAALIYKFADAHPDPFTVVRPMHAAKGLIVPYFLTPGAVASSNGYDRANRLTTEQVNILRAEGSQSGTQAWTTEAAQADYPAYVTEYQGSVHFNAAKGWLADAADSSFHSGVNADTPNARAAKIATGARSIQRFRNPSRSSSLPPMYASETFPFRDEMANLCINLAVFGAGSQTAVAQAMAQIDAAVACKGVVCFSVHGNVAGNENTVDVINAIADRYIAVGDFEYHTPNSLHANLLAQYGPAPAYPFAYSGES